MPKVKINSIELEQVDGGGKDFPLPPPNNGINGTNVKRCLMCGFEMASSSTRCKLCGSTQLENK